MKYPTFVTVAFTITSEQAEWLSQEALNTQGFNKSALAREAIELLRAKREGSLNQLIYDELVQSKENADVQETQHSPDTG